jgi:hypothetical protein
MKRARRIVRSACGGALAGVGFLCTLLCFALGWVAMISLRASDRLLEGGR